MIDSPRAASSSVGVATFLGTLVLLAFGTGCSEHDSSSNASRSEDLPACAVHIEQAQADNTPRFARVVGVTEPVRRTSPAARTMARVTKADFHEGQRVSEGQVLAQLDTRDLGTRRKQAKAAQDAGHTALSLARTHLKRMHALYATGDIPKSQLEQAEMAFAQAQATAATASAAVEAVGVNLSYARVVAPFAGVIVRRLVEVGNLVAPGQPVAVLEDDAQLRIVAPIGSDLAKRVALGQKVSVELGESRVSATVQSVISSGDTRAPGLRLQLLVENPNQLYRAGTIAIVELPRNGDGISGVRIPSDALFERGQLTGVFVVNEQSEARLRWIVIAETAGDSIRVLSGLRVGERVAIARDPNCLSDGRRVTTANR
ncbi:MAG: hypothetical protein DRH30_01510 [Deltaproteobacteria bacterium]|nr:MAG: hypothetical protein DRH30_01510 [Deltaproteobacteria bacterium]